MVPFEGGTGWRVAAVLVLLALSSFLQFSVVLGTKVNDPIRADAEKHVSYAYNLEHAGIFPEVNTWDEADVATRSHVLAAERTGQMAAVVLAAIVLCGLALATTHSLWLRTRRGKVGSGLPTLTRIPTNGC